MVSESFQELRAVDAASTAAYGFSTVPGTDSHPYTEGLGTLCGGWGWEDWLPGWLSALELNWLKSTKLRGISRGRACFLQHLQLHDPGQVTSLRPRFSSGK